MEDPRTLVESFKDPAKRHRAAALLSGGLGARANRGRVLAPEKIDALIEGLGHANAAVRRVCLDLLDAHPSERAVPHVVLCLDDPVPRVRWHAVHALRCDVCKAGASFLTPALLERLRAIAETDPSPKVRREARLGLSEAEEGRADD